MKHCRAKSYSRKVSSSAAIITTLIYLNGEIITKSHKLFSCSITYFKSASNLDMNCDKKFVYFIR